jgi:malate dehydrogenase (oxaloacetate-decarboxylating)(NADP+)
MESTIKEKKSTAMKAKKIVVPKERGVKLLHNPVQNKGTAFTERERQIFGLKGLLPPKAISQDLQARRVLENMRKKPDDLERYMFLTSLQDRNENLFYRVVIDNLFEIMPIIYTPTVGKACQNFGHIYRRPRGLYLSFEDKGHFREILRNWPHDDPRVIVVTDGGRILGLGDLGVNGMGIPIGKLSLYTACAGIHPVNTLPITLDLGTNNEKLLNDPLYMGVRHRRIDEAEYNEILDEFVVAVQEVFPNALIQLEDFATSHAFELLKKYRDEVCLFDDDIQGTAAVALAGIFSALRITGGKLEDQRILYLGAGEAGIGIGDIVTAALQEEGVPLEKARLQNWFVDSRGLVCSERKDLAKHKLDYAHDHPFIERFADVVKAIRPTAIIGVSGQPGKFDQEVIELMSEYNDHPIIFALSNPTANSECTAEQAYRWSKGRAIFASGSPFDPVELDGKMHYPGQGNNAYIFPGIGLGAVFSGARLITNRMFSESARVVASMVKEEELAKGMIYPELKRIREVSAKIAEVVTKIAVEEGLCQGVFNGDILEEIEAFMYEPDYPEYY